MELYVAPMVADWYWCVMYRISMYLPEDRYSRLDSPLRVSCPRTVSHACKTSLSHFWILPKEYVHQIAMMGSRLAACSSPLVGMKSRDIWPV
jgi:hypothetical protein